MVSRVEERLKQLGLTLPTPAASVAAYVPFVAAKGMLFVSGQLPMENGAVRYKGKVGHNASFEDAQAAARLCAVNILAQVKAACGDLDKVIRCVRLGGFVACSPDFIDHPKVINGASELMLEVFGDAGRHARAAVGVPSLPLDALAEVDAIFEIA